MAGSAKRRRLAPETVEAIFVLFVLALVVGAGMVGWVVGREGKRPASAAAETAAPLPPGHVGGPNLPVEEIGDPVKGAQLWEEKRCFDCHAIDGQGGTDAPPLDFMRGHVSAREIANMSGRIWNHLPDMLPHFEEEGIPVPLFEDEQMADLVAFLHGGTGNEPVPSAPEAEAGTPEPGETAPAPASDQ